jgi:hypothetical protein
VEKELDSLARDVGIAYDTDQVDSFSRRLDMLRNEYKARHYGNADGFLDELIGKSNEKYLRCPSAVDYRDAEQICNKRAEELYDTTWRGDTAPKVFAQEGLYGGHVIGCVSRFRLYNPKKNDCLEDEQGTLLRLKRVGNVLKSRYPHFPFEASIFSTHGPAADPWGFDGVDRSRPFPAFLYTALAVKENKDQRFGALIEKDIRDFLAKLERLDPAHDLMKKDLYSLAYPDPNWPQRTYVYVEYPTAELPSNFSIVERPTFYRGMRSKKVTWYAGYGDIGTGLPVLTAATPVRDAQDEVIGMAAVDLRLTAFSQYDVNATSILANLLFTFISTVILFGILYASNQWKSFQYIFYFMTWLYVFYYVHAVSWLIHPLSPTVRLVFHEVEALMSIVNSILLLFAAAAFDQLEQRESFIGSILPRVERFFGKYPGASHFFVISAASLTVWIITLLIEHAVRVGDGGSIDITRWIDAFLSFLALLLFGSRFATWCYSFMQARLFAAYLSGIVFLSYAALQLLRPLGLETRLFWVLLWGKMIMVSLILCVVFSYTQKYNYIRRQLAKVARKLLSRPTAQRMIVVIGKRYAGVSTVLSLSSAACRALGYFEKGAEGRTTSNRSVLGDYGFYEPEREMSIEEMFSPGEWARVEQELWSSSPDENEIRQTSPGWVQMKRWDGRSVSAFLHTVTDWRDNYVGGEIHPQHYVVAIASEGEELYWMTSRPGSSRP